MGIEFERRSEAAAGHEKTPFGAFFAGALSGGRRFAGRAFAWRGGSGIDLRGIHAIRSGDRYFHKSDARQSDHEPRGQFLWGWSDSTCPDVKLGHQVVETFMQVVVPHQQGGEFLKRQCRFHWRWEAAH